MSAEMIKMVKDLLDTYRGREWRIGVLEHELANPAKVTKDEQIEAMNFGHGDGIGYTKGRVSDKTLYIAMNYEEQVARLNAETPSAIAAELFELKRKQSKLKLYVSLLEKRQAEVIRMLCFEKTPAVQVAKHYDVTERTIERIKKSAIEHLAEMYEYVERFKG